MCVTIACHVTGGTTTRVRVLYTRSCQADVWLANQSGNISTSFSAGLTAGAFVWGFLVDIIGRQWAFNLTCLISASFGLGLGGCNTYPAFLVVTAFVGFGVGGNIPIDTTICLEFIPQVSVSYNSRHNLRHYSLDPSTHSLLYF